MHDVRIQGIQEGLQQRELTLEDRRRRLHLFAHSRMEERRTSFAGIGELDLSALRASTDDRRQDNREQAVEADEIISVRLDNGQQLEMPRMSKPDRARLQAVLGELSPAERDEMLRRTRTVGAAAYGVVLNDQQTALAHTEALQAAAGQTAEYYAATVDEARRGEEVSDSVILGVAGVEQELYDYFDRVRDEQGVADEVRADVAELEMLIADWPDDDSVETFSYREVTRNDDGTLTVTEHEVELTKAEAEALLIQLKGEVEGLGQFNTLEMARLQYMVNKYQEALNVTSNMMQNVHDTQKAVITNVKA